MPVALLSTSLGRLSVPALALAVLLSPGPTAAYQTLSVTVSDTEDDTLGPLLDAALSLANLDEAARADGAQVLAAAQADYAQALAALYSAGYYGASVSITLDGREAAEIPRFPAPPRVNRAAVTVTPGRAFRVGSVRIAPLAPGDALPEALSPGAPAGSSALRSAIGDRIEAWRAASHAKAEIADQQIIARHATARLDIAVRIAAGPPLRFGDLPVVGDTRVRPARIRQIAGVPRGAPFSPATLARAEARLRQAGTFRVVSLTETETPNPDGTLDIEIEVVDRAPRRIGAGAELSADEGLTLNGFWLHRNILGGAEQLRLEGTTSHLGAAGLAPDYALSAAFEKPAVYGPDTRFFALAEIDYLDEPDYLVRSARLSFGASRTFSDSLEGSLGVALTRARVIERFRDTAPGEDDPERDFNLISLPAAVTWDRRDDPQDARTGTYLGIEAEPFTLSDGRGAGAHAMLDMRAYRGIGTRTVLAGRFQLGTLIGVEAVDAPPDYLFYSGGGGTVRGQPFRALDAEYGTERLGGRSFAAASAEIRLGLRGAFGAVAFADLGFVGPEPVSAEGGDWHAGAGLGLRYDTAIGPIRFDVAGPVGGATGDGVQLYIGIGQAF
jgi:translocation and assembly module TamA